MKFAIPLKREDLAHAPENKWEYYVKEVFSVRELKTKLKDCELGAKQSGCDFLLSGGFDVLYSVLAHYHKDLPSECKESAFNILSIAMGKLEKELDNVLAEGQYLSASEKQTYLNKLKMAVYLFCQIIEQLEVEDSSTASDALFTKGGTGRAGSKKSKSSVSATSNLWEPENKVAAITRLYRLLHLNIAMLFDPPVVERELVNVIACCLFRFLETPSIALQRSKDLRGSIIQVLGTLNSKFGYSLSCRLKIVQSLRHFEHLAVAMAEAVDTFARDFNCSSMIMEIVREISQIDTAELSRDTSATRSYSTFLGDLAERQPERMKPCLSLLMAHLDGDSSSMRKCILSILGEIILRVLSSATDEASKDSRDQFLDCLEDHVHDVHAHVRASVLQIWGKLCLAKTIPLNRQQRLLKLVIGRLQDKSSSVRKQAVQLLTTLLQCNPFAANMPVEELKGRLKEEQEKLAAMTASEGTKEGRKNLQKKREEEWLSIENEVLKDQGEEMSSSDEEEVWENATKDEILSRLQHLMQKRRFPRVQSLLRSAKIHFPEDDLLGGGGEKGDSIDEEEQLGILKAIYVAAAAAPADDGEEEDEAVKMQRVLVAYHQDYVDFAEEVNKALPTVCTLLGSKQVTDILEAVNFFVSAYEFGLLNAMMGVRQMLALIWSRETVVKEAVVEAYKRLYVNSEGTEAKARPADIIRNFIALVSGATIGDLTSLEELVCMLVKTKDLDKDCFQVLWQHFTKCHESTTDEQARSALILLGMIGNVEPTVITSNLPLLIKTALSTQGEEEAAKKDFRLVYEACIAIGKITNVKTKSDEAPFKFEAEHEIFSSLRDILVLGLHDQDRDFYIPMSQKAVTVIYQFSEQPDVICGKIIKEICQRILPTPPSALVKRLISLVGNVALCQLNYLEVNVMGELKRRKGLRDLHKEKKKRGRKSSLGKRRQSKSGSQQEDDEMEMIGAEADDTEIEFIRNVCENEILGSNATSNLLSAFVPLIVHICLHPNKYPDSQLRIAASLALAKLMLISSNFCEDNLQVLFTMMEKSDDPVIRANLIIASGDLSFRFPNTLEPWTPHMYGRLRDDSPLVRSNTLTVLTHLILNDMIKVKGQISDMALCISDGNDKISGLSKHFFAELARKGNALYNVMPDIISRLSSAESQVPEKQFRFIMSYIVGLIEKDKHLESLVEKLCHRFRATQTERQWRDLAYCLSLFTFSDKAVKKLQDNFGCYSDKLHDEEVYNSLTGILVHARKLAKNETRTAIDELEDMLTKAQEKCAEEHGINVRAKGAKKQQQTARKKTVAESDDEEEEEEEKSNNGAKKPEEEEQQVTPPPTERKRARSKRSRPIR